MNEKGGERKRDENKQKKGESNGNMVIKVMPGKDRERASALKRSIEHASAPAEKRKEV